MSSHDLRRNPNNEPVCVCGYRPEILDDYSPMWKAKKAVLDHAEALNKYEVIVDDVAFSWPLETPATVAALRSPGAPFVVPEARYPRAGVRQMADGRWLLMGWDREDVAHGITDVPWFDDRAEAFEVGRIIIGAHRQSGTSLNGLAA